MYSKLTIVNKSEHADLKFKQVSDMRYAEKVSHVVLTLGEYFAACKSQPILFVKTEKEIMSCALMGIQQDVNLFLDARKNWYATEYCPFFFKRYPFIYVPVKEKLTLAFDSECQSANTEQGEALFDEKGEQTEFTKKIVELMNRYQADTDNTIAFCKKVDEMGLLEPLDITLSVGSNKYKLESFLKVSEKRFNELTTEQKVELIDLGYYNFLVAHLISLANFEKLRLLAAVKMAEVKNA